MGTVAEQDPEFATFAKDIRDNKRIKPNRRVFDTKKVSDHFAIIPTGKMEKGMSPMAVLLAWGEPEQKMAGRMNGKNTDHRPTSTPTMAWWRV